MINKNLKYYASSFIWGVIAKVLDAIIKFLTTPMLLLYFGKEDFGLITLAISINVYTNLLDMGMNTGSVKFFSRWLDNHEYKLLDRVSRTSITFYLIIGFINSLVFLLLAIFADSIFNVTAEQIGVFQNLMLILAVSSIFNWSTYVFYQLLVADEKMGLIQRIFSARSILLLLITIFTISLKLTISQYFAGYILVNVFIIVPYYVLCKKYKLITSLLPAFYWKNFSVILNYSLAIFAIGIFQLTATQSRPIILGIFSKSGMNILADYRIIEVFPAFIISIGGMIISIFLPKASKYIAEKDKAQIEAFAYRGTLYTSIITSVLCFLIILVSKEILALYIGVDYEHLYVWMSLWVFTLTLSLHNSPVSSLVLVSGKTKKLVYMTAISCVVSIIINILLCNIFNVGSAVIGYLVYIVMQMSFYYLYFNRKVLNLKSWNVFKSFAIPFFLALFLTLGVELLNIKMDNLYYQSLSKVVVWLFLYGLLLVLSKCISLRDVKQLLNK